MSGLPPLSSQEFQLAQLCASMFAVRSKQSVSDWCEQNLWLPSKLTPRPGPFRITDMNYLERPLNCWGDPDLSDIDYCFGTQVAKTTLLMCGMGWSIINDPGNTLWKLPTIPVARSFNRRRWHVFIKANEVLRAQMPADKDYFTLLEQHFHNCFVKFTGSNSTAELIESPVRRVVDDETDASSAAPKADQPSSSELADERTKAFLNSQRIKASSPSTDPSIIWNSLHRGTNERYSVICPDCEVRFFMDWRDKDGGYFIKWDPAARRPDGTWDKIHVRETAYYECPRCKKHLNDSDKVQMLRRGHGAEWKATNPNPAPRHVSFQLGSIYSPWVTFAKMAEKWLDSSNSIYGLRIFINGWLGEVFNQVESEEVEFPASDYSMCKVLPADVGYKVENPDPWPFDTFRLMTIDKQEGKTDPRTGIKDTPHLKVLVCDWQATGASRRLWYGRLPNEDEARALQTAFGIHSGHVYMDHGYKGTEVSRICAKFGWTALKGDDRDYFIHVLKGSPGTTQEISVRRPYAPRQKIAAYIGTEQSQKTVRLHLWSNPTIKDALQLFKTGKGPEWNLPRDIPEDYLLEIRAEARRKKFMPQTGKEVSQWVRVKGKDGRPMANEALDLECMQIVGALLCKIKLVALGDASPVDPAA